MWGRQFTFPLLLLGVALLSSAESRAQGSIDPVVAGYIKGLSNPNPSERRDSALALGNMAAGNKFDAERAKRAVPALARAMKDKDENVREFAAFALGNIRADPEISIPALIGGLQDNGSSVRKRSAEVLRGLGGEAQPAGPALLDALRDQDAGVREEAAKAVGEIVHDPRTAVPALADAFKNFPTGSYAFAGALAKYRQGALGAVPTLVEILQERDGARSADAALVIGTIGPEAVAAVPALIDALKDPNRYIAARAAAALGRIGQNQKDAAAVAARVVAEDLGGEPWWNRAAAAEALGELGLYGEAALPALSKALAHSDPAGASARAADAILRIASALRDARRTTAIPVLKACQTAMESSQSGYIRTQALDLADVIAALETMRRGSPRDLLVSAVQEHSSIAVAIAVYVSAGLLWISLLWVWPMSIFRIGQLVRAFPKVKLPGWLGGIEISFAHLIIVGFFQNRDRVLDAWVAKSADLARARFEEIETVRRCGSLSLGGVILDGVTTTNLQPLDLQSAFSRSKTCVLIHGDQGTGKTRLACEVARWGLAADRSDRLRKNLMLPAFLEENFTYAADKDASPFISAISEKLQILDLEPPPEEVLLQLLRRKRLLVIVDGLSELNEETRTIIRPASPDFPAHALVVTSCKEETLGGMRRTMIKTDAAPVAEALTRTEAIENS
jgi:HEAT repeat protein